jgi:hypothetical protein
MLAVGWRVCVLRPWFTADHDTLAPVGARPPRDPTQATVLPDARRRPDTWPPSPRPLTQGQGPRTDRGPFRRLRGAAGREHGAGVRDGRSVVSLPLVRSRVARSEPILGPSQW